MLESWCEIGRGHLGSAPSSRIHLMDKQRASAHQAFSRAAGLTAEVARRIVEVIRQDKLLLIPGVDAKITYTIRWLSPKRLPVVLNAIFGRVDVSVKPFPRRSRCQTLPYRYTRRTLITFYSAAGPPP